MNTIGGNLKAKQIGEHLYAQIKRRMPIPCVDLVLHQDNKVLLCKRLNNPLKGEWWLPGGRVLLGETLEEAVHRKAKEELGIGINIVRQVKTYDNIFPKDSHSIATVYQVVPMSEDIKLDAQHNYYEWFDMNRLPHLKTILIEVLKDSKEVN